MKKIFILLALSFILYGCNQSISYPPDQQRFHEMIVKDGGAGYINGHKVSVTAIESEVGTPIDIFYVMHASDCPVCIKEKYKPKAEEGN